MICDVCVTTIHSPPYYHSPTCNNYFVHSTCYLLPKNLSCPDVLKSYGDCPKTHENHKFSLYTGSELDNTELVECGLCRLYSNGRVYGCGDCRSMIGVKCAALPTTIKHASHQHLLVQKKKEEIGTTRCGGCRRSCEDGIMAYHCTSYGYNFALHIRCLMCPPSIEHEWDKHTLTLTYDASTDHPDDFYCEMCEEEMHPKEWMYHCRDCDRSFETICVQSANIKYGRQVEFDCRVHPHPLTMTKVSLKLRCDVCQEECYDTLGFQCDLCNFVLCYDCGVEELNDGDGTDEEETSEDTEGKRVVALDDEADSGDSEGEMSEDTEGNRAVTSGEVGASGDDEAA